MQHNKETFIPWFMNVSSTTGTSVSQGLFVFFVFWYEGHIKTVMETFAFVQKNYAFVIYLCYISDAFMCRFYYHTLGPDSDF